MGQPTFFFSFFDKYGTTYMAIHYTNGHSLGRARRGTNTVYGIPHACRIYYHISFTICIARRKIIYYCYNFTFVAYIACC